MSDFERDIDALIPRLDRLEESMAAEKAKEQLADQQRRIVKELGNEAISLLMERSVEPLPILRLVEGTRWPHAKYTPIGSGWHVYDKVERTDDGTRRTAVGLDLEGKLLTFPGSLKMDGQRNIINPDYVERWGPKYALALVENDNFKMGIACLIRFNRPYEPK